MQYTTQVEAERIALAAVGENTTGEHTTLPSRLVPLYAALLTGNAIAWLWAVVEFRDKPALTGMAVLAYVLGLRHAVDADHIAAIDNVTRKFVQQGTRSETVGLYFSLGHSTVVTLACAVIAGTSLVLATHFDALRDIGGLVGTGVSAAFLLVIALTNMSAVAGLWRSLRQTQKGIENISPQSPGSVFIMGPLGRILRPVFAFVSRPWHMYFLGFLFGLGFDTASEVSLLGISASQATQSLPIWSIMIFPALFTAGMSLVDTTDGVVMTQAYDWAFIKPTRRLYYNITITLISVVVALVVGALEVLNLIADRLLLGGNVWSWIANANDHFGAIGCLIVVTLLSVWGISAFINRA